MAFVSRKLLGALSRIPRPMLVLLALLVLGLVLGWVSTSGAKTQMVRIIDVVILGPVMIVAGGIVMQRERAGPGARVLGAVLVLFGAATIAYNARNFAHERG
jgi:uncharacterized membrane protein